MGNKDWVRRAQMFADLRGLAIGAKLGDGVHGIVYSAMRQADGGRIAMKVHGDETCYARERDIYIRLRDEGVSRIHD